MRLDLSSSRSQISSIIAGTAGLDFGVEFVAGVSTLITQNTRISNDLSPQQNEWKYLDSMSVIIQCFKRLS